MQEYHNRIRELREEKHITQVRLSTELGVAQETISAYEQGRHLPSVSSLMKLSSILDASMDYIMMKSDVRNISVPISYFSRYPVYSAVLNISLALAICSLSGGITSESVYGIPNSSHLNTPSV